MLKLFQFLAIILEILILLQAKDDCDFADCNHEGECQFANKEKNCSCIGKKYFQGPTCSEAIDLCQTDKPCKNGGKCEAVTGQFMCKECNMGFGGLWCDSSVSNAFTNMLLYFNHYGLYSHRHKFLIIAETLGEVAFSLELVSDHYAIDSFETKPPTKKGISKWTFSNDLYSILDKENIRYHNHLPYQEGYYHLATETFWNYDLLNVTLRSYDTETGSTLFFQYTYDLLIMKNTPKCLSQLTFLHGANPLDPLVVDIARHNNFEAIIKERCFPKSHVVYKWNVFNSIGTTKLYDFGTTNSPLLKVPPYKLWFNYHGEIMSSYQIRIRMEETFEQQVTVTQSSCFILVLPKPVKAIIKGGSQRAIGLKQDILMDGSESRDFALASDVLQNMIYSWDCVSEDDMYNRYCKTNIGTDKNLRLQSGVLNIKAHYKFTLHISSKVNKLMSDETQQLVEIVSKPQLFIQIKCIRNCIRQKFINGNFIHLKTDMVSGKLSKAAKFNWTCGEDFIGRERRLIYKPKETDVSLKFNVVVEDGEMSGKASIDLTANEPPHDGSCSIDPLEGEAYVTLFKIKCQDYQDEDMPLNYQFLVGEFPLQRTNDPEIFIKLPETDKVLVKVCDQFDACVDQFTSVSVTGLSKPTNLTKFITSGDSKLSKLLKNGDVLSAMILMKSLATHIKTMDDASVLMNETQFYALSTLIGIEQFFAITKDIFVNNLPLDYKKSKVFANYFEKLSKGFEAVTNDGEIKNIMKSSYDKLSKELLEIMEKFSQTWETLPQPQIIEPTIVQEDNKLAEHYDDLADFDILSIERVLSWLNATIALDKCSDSVGLAGVQVYKPSEDPLIIHENVSILQIYGWDKIEKHNVTFKNGSIVISLDEPMIEDLQQQLQSTNVLLQITSLDNNPFWWFPDDQPPAANVFQLSAFSRTSSSSRSQINLKNPLQFQLKLKEQTSSSQAVEIEGMIKSELHMPIYRMELNANALLIVTFVRTMEPLKIKLEFTENPRSFEVKNKGLHVNPFQLTENYVFANQQNEKVLARLAILLDTDKENVENVTFAFHTEIQECLFWDFELPDPQWSSRGCRALLITNKSLDAVVKCECYHLSSFTAKSYTKAMSPDLRNRDLFPKIPTNWSMVAFYTSLLVIFAIILIYNFLVYKNHKEYLSPNSYNDNSNIEIRLYTGSHWNAGTTANITIRIVSEKSPFSLTVYQNPEKPHLKRSSVCKLRISSKDVKNPRKITLHNDQAGRYPSWYCRRIEIENMKSKEKQIQLFQINQWISENSLEMTTDHKSSTFKEMFIENLSTFYIEWYQFNPLWGTWQYEDFNRFERSCIWMSQFMSSLCVLACYYGRTTMESYEKEREMYYSLKLNVSEVLALAASCYFVMIVIKLLFVLILKHI